MGRGGWLFGNDAASTRLPQGAATLAGIAAAIPSELTAGGKHYMVS